MIASLGVAVLACGCKSGHSFAGKWTIPPPENLPPGATFSATFADPNKVSLVLDFPQPLPTGKTIQIHGDVVGTYTADETSMTIHADTVKFTTSGLPDNVKSIAESQMTPMSDSLKEQLNKQGKTKLTWTDNDHFTLSGSTGKPETFTRSK